MWSCKFFELKNYDTIFPELIFTYAFKMLAF